MKVSCSTHGEVEKHMQNLVGEPEEKKTLGGDLGADVVILKK
jgi:hypothetical protein